MSRQPRVACDDAGEHRQTGAVGDRPGVQKRRPVQLSRAGTFASREAFDRGAGAVEPTAPRGGRQRQRITWIDVLRGCAEGEDGTVDEARRPSRRVEARDGVASEGRTAAFADDHRLVVVIDVNGPILNSVFVLHRFL